MSASRHGKVQYLTSCPWLLLHFSTFPNLLAWTRCYTLIFEPVKATTHRMISCRISPWPKTVPSHLLPMSRNSSLTTIMKMNWRPHSWKMLNPWRTKKHQTKRQRLLRWYGSSTTVIDDFIGEFPGFFGTGAVFGCVNPRLRTPMSYARQTRSEKFISLHILLHSDLHPPQTKETLLVHDASRVSPKSIRCHYFWCLPIIHHE